MAGRNNSDTIGDAVRFLFLLLCLLAGPVFAAGNVSQSGTVSPSHPAMWVSPGVIGDAGAATNGYLTNLGLFQNGGLPACITASTTPRATFNPASSPYSQLCLYANQGGNGGMTLNSYNGAAAESFVVNVNGVNYPFPGSSSGSVNGPASTTIGYAASWNNSTGTLLGQGYPVGTSGNNSLILSNASGRFGSNVMPSFTGDMTSTAGTTVSLVGSVNGVSYPANPSTNTVPVVTSSNTITYEAVPVSALASSSTTVAGQTCALGSSCSIAYSNLSSGAPIATNSLLGLVKPDGSTITITAGGVISAATSGGTLVGPGAGTTVGYAPLWSNTLGTGVGFGLPVATTGNSTIVETSSGGLIAASILPQPTASTLGGVESLAAVSHKWINTISTSGAPAATQPGFTDLSGGIAVAQMNSGTNASATTFWRGDGTWSIANECTTIESYGGVADGSTDNTAALNSALSGLSASGGCISFGSGVYYFASAISLTMPNTHSPNATLYSVALRGQGADATLLKWGASGGMSFTYQNWMQSVHIRDMAIVTTAANSGTAITLTSYLSTVGFSPSDIENVAIYGLGVSTPNGRFGENYWAAGISITNIGNILMDNIIYTGHGVYGTAVGTAIAVGGTQSGASCPSLPSSFVLSNSQINAAEYGFVYGTCIQGVTITNTSFVGGNFGIVVPSSEIGLAQLTVVADEFDWGGGSGPNAIYMASALPDTMISSNLFLVTNTNDTGVGITNAANVTIIGNTFTASTSGSYPVTANGVVIASNIATGSAAWTGTIISNNTFGGISNGVVLDAGTAGNVVNGNVFGNVTTNVNNLGSGNFVNSVADSAPAVANHCVQFKDSTGALIDSGGPTCGAGSANSWTAAQTFTQINETSTALTGCNGSTATINLASGTYFNCTISTGAVTLAVSNPPTSGLVGEFVLELTNGGTETITFPTNTQWPGGSAPTFTSSGTDVITCYTRDAGSHFKCFAAGLNVH